MMLVTLACAPPSCLARLAQKFSTATTVTVRGSPAAVAPVVAHPVRVMMTGRATPAAHRGARRRGAAMAQTLTIMGLVFKCACGHTFHDRGGSVPSRRHRTAPVGHRSGQDRR